MALIFGYLRRHSPAVLVLGYMAWRASRDDIRVSGIVWLCVVLGATGVAMNLIVILGNGYMPAKVLDEEIPDDAKPHYRPMDGTTRLAFLGDWIPVGSLVISPGDILLVVGAAALLAKSFFG